MEEGKTIDLHTSSRKRKQYRVGEQLVRPRVCPMSGGLNGGENKT